MDVFDAIRLRRSVKPLDMKPDPVPRAMLERLLEAANWAPSHRVTEPWRFIVFTGDARIALGETAARTLSPDGELDPSHPKQSSTIAKMSHAPVVIAIVCQPSTLPKVVEHEEIISTAIAAQHIQLGARAMGLGSYWSSGDKIEHPRMAEFLDIAAPARCLGFLFVGWPRVEWPEGSRRPIADKVAWRS